MDQDQQDQLRAPFDAAQIGKLPRAGLQLDYVGHAAVTDRLLKVDREWSWNPVAFGPDGAPLITEHEDGSHSMWITLTVCGMTRIGVGTTEPKKNEYQKQLISDALRNAAMRFGVALDLWSKQDLDDPGPPPVLRTATEDGWESETRATMHVQELKNKIGLLSDEDKATIKDYSATLGVDWPPTAIQWTQLNARVDELAFIQKNLSDGPESSDEPTEGNTAEPESDVTQAITEAFPGSKDITPAPPEMVSMIVDLNGRLDLAGKRAVTKYIKEKHWPAAWAELTKDQAKDLLDYIEML